MRNLTKFNKNFLLLIFDRRNLQSWRYNWHSDLSLLTCFQLTSFFSLYNLFIDITFTIWQTKFNLSCWQLIDGKKKKKKKKNIYKVFRGLVNNKYKDGKDLWHLTFLSSFTIHLVASSLSHAVYVVLLILNFYCYIKFL